MPSYKDQFQKDKRAEEKKRQLEAEQEAAQHRKEAEIERERSQRIRNLDSDIVEFAKKLDPEIKRMLREYCEVYEPEFWIKDVTGPEEFYEKDRLQWVQWGLRADEGGNEYINISLGVYLKVDRKFWRGPKTFFSVRGVDNSFKTKSDLKSLAEALTKSRPKVWNNYP